RSGGNGGISGGGGGGGNTWDGGDGGIGGGGGGGGADVRAGRGGEFGGGGGASNESGSSGNGGFGGGGGGTDDTNSGIGGFGGGSGASINGGGGGAYAGDGGAGDGDADGGGGAALGGAVFVRDGGSLTIINSSFSGTYAVNEGTTGGAGGATNGEAQGAIFFLHGSATTNLQINTGTQSFDGDDELAGNGNFTKSGVGTLEIGGANSNYTGELTVSDGTLTLSDTGSIAATEVFVNGGTLAGNGTFNGNVTANGGTIAPGNSIGTTTINGDFDLNSGSTLLIEVIESAADQVIVNGGVSVDGATLQLDLALALSDVNDTFVIVSNDGGDAVTGTGFGTIFDNLSFLDPLISLVGGDGNDIELSFTAGIVDFSTVAQTPNQSATGSGLNSATRTDPDIDALFDQFLPMTNAEVHAALDNLSGEVYAPTLFALNSNGLFLANNITKQIRGIPANGGSVGQFQQHDNASNALGYAPQQTADALFGINDPQVVALEPKHFFFSEGLLRNIAIEADGNGAATDIWNTGFLAGGGIALNDYLKVGLSAGYLNTQVSIPDRSSTAEIDSYALSAFGQYELEGWDVTGTFGYVHSGVETNRDVVVGAINQTANGDYNAHTLLASFELGYESIYEQFAFRPFISAAISGTHRNGFTETGAAGANLDVAASTHALGQVSTGVSASTNLNIGEILIIPSVEIALDQLVGDVTPSSTASFIPGGADFNISGATPSHTRGRISAGFAAKLSNHATGFIDYQGTFSQNDAEHAGTMGFKIKF
ncbi:MAG: autotransporter domain-containing protein, partial [Hyphomicrobiales bacterium]